MLPMLSHGGIVTVYGWYAINLTDDVRMSIEKAENVRRSASWRATISFPELWPAKIRAQD